MPLIFWLINIPKENFIQYSLIDNNCLHKSDVSSSIDKKNIIPYDISITSSIVLALASALAY